MKSKRCARILFTKNRVFAFMLALVVSIAMVACTQPEPTIVEVTREVQVEVQVMERVEVEVTRIVQPTMAPDAPKEKLVFNDLNWNSALIQNRIAQYIVDKGYGYPTEVLFGGTLPLFQGLRRGDSHITMEIWLPNQDEAWAEAQAAGEVVSVGESLGKDWQSAFVIPKYLQEQYPELDSVEDLKDEKFQKLFATAATGGKARLVSCVIGWACEEVNAAQIEGYGLTEFIEVVSPGDGAALSADLYGAYEKKEPWLGYQWGHRRSGSAARPSSARRTRVHRRMLVHDQGLRLPRRHHPHCGQPRRPGRCPRRRRDAEGLGFQHRSLQGSRCLAPGKPRRRCQ